ncbi:MAG: hypothetical protein IKF39_03765 [Oscillospiraceae bacterium]|nr:hypothetical protein [Oscillospiraceae bacterium]
MARRLYHDVKVIDARSRMLDFSNEVRITTDAQEMEDLYNRARNMPECDEKLFILEQAFALYRGRLFVQGEDSVGNWLYTYTSHYNQIFVHITTEMLQILGHHRDFRCILDFGPKALELEPGIQFAYYWIIIAADGMGNSVTKDKFLQKAEQELIEEEYEKLQQLLAVHNQK